MTLTTSPYDDDHLHEECAIYGIFGTSDAAAHTALGLHALQHRGQEAAGIVATDGTTFNVHRGLGHVGENFGEDNQEVMDQLVGHSAIGHTRYSTTGETALRNVQPLFADLEFGGFALCHNGNLTNALQVREGLVRQGSIFQSTMDTEVIIHLIARSRRASVVDRLVEAMNQVEGGYSLICLSKDTLIGLRDPFGVRPLVLGKIGDAYILCSETCGLDIIGADFVRDINPGELVVIDAKGVRSFFPFRPRPSRFCIFEYIYFARPDSMVEGHSVYAARKGIGSQLARESGVDADVVVPVPDSGVPAAIGYAEASGLPFELGIIRNHYVGRTFIQPTDKVRHLGVKLKHNANRGQLEGKRVILVDDSIVRGTTSTKIVEMVRQAGATEVHMRIASPPTTHSCFYGVDTPERSKLLAAQLSVEEMAEKIGVDSLAFISIDGLYRAMGEAARNNEQPQFCDACFTGDYPIALTDYSGGRTRQLSLLAEAS
ncbi:amidophosphoribosyltransferase [Thalassobaculum sp. OXR-137]|uniref:amidophosphoribosyltransferase n=1 Tax=Thalassobaculum sp. OXR-137 TaxID=3100173 RepID=UPI002AC9D259|nr:amidophosphoribosyltransferase [Thalassobaculum sp. OXR-137]WPZ33676.1 amidophosphoribosyltransferase [Thalassobaculum sp. OXR-137]